jgi:hypothetical protein
MLSVNDNALMDVFNECGISVTEYVITSDNACPYHALGPSKSEVAYGSNGWDSLKHMVLVSELENKFDIIIDIEDIVKIESYHVARAMLTEKYGIKFDV